MLVLLAGTDGTSTRTRTLWPICSSRFLSTCIEAELTKVVRSHRIVARYTES